MEREIIRRILGIQKIEDEKKVKAAYLAKLKETNPEDDPEGFRRLREAYEEALDILSQTASEEEGTEPGEAVRWLSRAKAIYEDFRSRRDWKAWREFLSDPFCQELDTALEARDALIGFLLSHFYLHREIWTLLDQELSMVEDMESLKERFPADFLAYVRHYTQNDYFLDFSQMKFRKEAVPGEEQNVDGYIRAYLELNGKCGRGEWKEAREALEELQSFAVFYFWEDVERLLILEAEGRFSEAGALADVLEREHRDSPYAVSRAAHVKWTLGDKETAFAWWSRVPENLEARYGVIQYHMEKGELEEAKELVLEVLELDGGNGRSQELMKEINGLLIEKYKSQKEEPGQEAAFLENRLELAWCLFQNQDMGQALEILEQMEPTEELYYSYHNLKGRVLAALERHKEAIPELKLWRSLIQKTVDDGSEEARKRLRRKGLATFLLGRSVRCIGHWSEATVLLEQGAKECTELSERLGCLYELAETCLQLKRYEQTVETCDRILALEGRYYPAYLCRQEAYYELRRPQEVVDDYHRAVEIYPGGPKPYILAAKVFFAYRQYQDVKGVLERAEQNQAQLGDEMRLMKLKALRQLAQTQEEYDEVWALLEKFQKELDPLATDLEDVSELVYLRGLLLWDQKRQGEALDQVNRAIRQNPSKLFYFMTKADLLRELEEYTEALRFYKEVQGEYGDTPSWHYGTAVCCCELGREEEGLSHYLKAAGLDAEYGDVNERIADIYMGRFRRFGRQEDFEKALAYMDREVETGENSYTLNHRGRMYLEAMRLTEAIADFEKALTYAEDSWVTYNNLGCCYKYLNQQEKGIEMYQKAIERLGQERILLPYSNLADCYEILQDYASAAACYERLLEWFPNEKFLYEELARVYVAGKEYDKAMANYRILESCWKDGENILDMADLEYFRGNRMKGAGYYQWAWKRFGDDSYELYQELARRKIALFGKYQEGLNLLDKAERLRAAKQQTVSEKCEARTWKYRAWASFCLGKRKQAQKYAKKAVELYLTGYASEEDYLNYPSLRPLRHSNLGVCYLYMGEREKAVRLFAQMGEGLRCKTCQTGACFERYLNMGYLHYCHGNKEEALKYFEKAAQISPSNADAWFMIQRLRKEINR